MLKIIFMRTLSILTVISLVIFSSCNFNKKRETVSNHTNELNQQNDYVLNPKLSSADYIEYEGYFPKEGFIQTAEIAFQVAEPILNKIYGKENIEEQKPFSVNLENDVWILEGHIDPGIKGGVAYMEIRKNNGEILKVVHGK